MGIRATLISSGAVTLVALPFTVFAATTDFFGPIVPQSGACLCNTPGQATAMDWGCLLQVFQNVLNVLVSVSILAVVFFIAWAGFTLIVSGSNPAGRTKAKNRMLNAVLGLMLILGSWLIVDAVMKVLYNPSTAFSGTQFGPWNEILGSDPNAYCLRYNANPGVLTTGINGTPISGSDILNPGTTGSSAGGSSAGGNCQVKTSGACASSNFTSAFGSAANQASQICSAESANGNLLQGDKTTSGDPVSFGLFQVNITAHQVAGLDCPHAFDSVFTGSHHNVKIINPALYQQCKTAALDPNNNAAAAAVIYNKDHGSFKEWSTASKCGISYNPTNSTLALSEACSLI
ncbi:MAG TPA: pilin [Candidatus Paceibacterota bacterium]|jgi:hypothetical protein|nr:pilin [Candidatus Paceibacterota bacterium]